jgi:hypothetical protein
MDDEVQESVWNRTEFYAAFARKEVLRFHLREAFACFVALIIVGLMAVSAIGVFTGRPDALLILISATVSVLWWKYMRAMFNSPTGLACPACRRNGAALVRRLRKNSSGYEWDLSCAQCGKCIPTQLGSD